MIMKNYTEGIKYYDKSRVIQPSNTVALVNKGIALRYLQRIDESIKCYDKALEINPYSTFR